MRHQNFFGRHQKTCSHSKFQNGNTKKSKKCYSTARLGIFVRPDGRLSSHSCPQEVTQIPSIYFERAGLSVSGSPVWTFHKPFCVHCCNEGDSHVPKNESDLSLPLPRRLAVKEPKSCNSTGTQTLHHPNDFFLGSTNQQGDPSQTFNFIGM